METNDKNYNDELQKIKTFFSKKRKLGYLASEVGVDVRTVHLAFKANSPQELTGKKIDVIIKAKELKTKMESDLTINQDPNEKTTNK